MYTKLTDVDGQFADRPTRYLLVVVSGGRDGDDHGEGGGWQEQGLCAQSDPELFFPEKGGSAQEAKQVCRRCPVLAECREYALANDEPWGVWGGLSVSERRRMRRAPLAA